MAFTYLTNNLPKAVKENFAETESRLTTNAGNIANLQANKVDVASNIVASIATVGSASKTLGITYNSQGELLSVTPITIEITTANISDAGNPGGVAVLDPSGLLPVGTIPTLPSTSLPAGVTVCLGDFDAALPTVIAPSPVLGNYYFVSVAGTIIVNSVTIHLAIGDILIYNGTNWLRLPGENSGVIGEVDLTVPGFTLPTSPTVGQYFFITVGGIVVINSVSVSFAAGDILIYNGTTWIQMPGSSSSGNSILIDLIVDGDVAHAPTTNAVFDAIEAVTGGSITTISTIEGSLTTLTNTVNNLGTALGDLLTPNVTDGDTTHAPTSDAVFDAIEAAIGSVTGGDTVDTVASISAGVVIINNTLVTINNSITNIIGDVNNLTTELNNLTTDHVAEGLNNLYYTPQRVVTDVLVDAITDGDVAHAPTTNAVFDALFAITGGSSTTINTINNGVFNINSNITTIQGDISLINTGILNINASINNLQLQGSINDKWFRETGSFELAYSSKRNVLAFLTSTANATLPVVNTGEENTMFSILNEYSSGANVINLSAQGGKLINYNGVASPTIILAGGESITVWFDTVNDAWYCR